MAQTMKFRMVVGKTVFLLLLAFAPIATCAGCGVWSSIGPYGGWISAIAVHPRNPSIVYTVGQYGDGVYKSYDGGAFWQRASGGLPEPTFLKTIAIDPLSPETLYAGGDLSLFKTVNGGISWTQILGYDINPQGLPYVSVKGISIHPQSPAIVYFWGDGAYSCILNSEDGGATWIDLPIFERVEALALDPADTGVLYIGGSGFLHKLTRGGWAMGPSGQGLPESFRCRALTIDPQNPAVLYAALDRYDGSRYGVYKSTDAGATWEPAREGLPEAVAIVSLAIDPIQPNTLYAAGEKYHPADVGGLYRSCDGGGSWVPINEGIWSTQRSFQALAVDPKTSGTLYAGCEGAGVFKSTDGGASWAHSSRGISLFLYSPAGPTLDSQVPGTLYASIFDAGLLKSVDGGFTWEPINGGLPDGSQWGVKIAPWLPKTLFSVNKYEGLYRSFDGGASWVVSSEGLPINGWGWVDVQTFVLDRVAPGVIYVLAGAGVYRSVDGGDSYAPVPGVFPPWGYAYPHLEADPFLAGTLYMATQGGGIFKSADGGATWTEKNAGLSHWEFSEILADPVTPGTLYAGNYSRQPLYKSTDGGDSWSPLGQWGDVLAIDPFDSSVLYLAWGYSGNFYQDHGAMRSDDGGATWAPLDNGLKRPWEGISGLSVDPFAPETVYAMTGGGFYAIRQVPIPGDCDGDGEVSIGEVQRAINMFVWGITPACSVDGDGSGEISIGEVQAAINVFLGATDWCL